MNVFPGTSAAQSYPKKSNTFLLTHPSEGHCVSEPMCDIPPLSLLISSKVFVDIGIPRDPGKWEIFTGITFLRKEHFLAQGFFTLFKRIFFVAKNR